MAVLEHDSQFMTRRGAVLVTIIALHLFIAWALATGLARRAIEVLAPPIQTDILQEEQKKVEPPPPPPPEFQRPPVEVPPPDITVDLPVETAQTTAITNVTTKAVAVAAPRAVARTPPGFSGKPPNTADYYPSASQRLGEEGSAVVHVCLDAGGKFAEGTPSVMTSSGKSRLDEGAIALARAARYKPSTEDGKPVPGCFNFVAKFQLR